MNISKRMLLSFFAFTTFSIPINATVLGIKKPLSFNVYNNLGYSKNDYNDQNIGFEKTSSRMEKKHN